MAIAMSGQKCPICGDPIISEASCIAFPTLTSDSNHPAYPFNDAIVHDKCFERSSDYPQISRFIERIQLFSQPKNRICNVCGVVITDWQEYFNVGYAFDMANDEFNFKHYHKRCLVDWPGTSEMLKILEKGKDGYLSWLTNPVS